MRLDRVGRQIEGFIESAPTADLQVGDTTRNAASVRKQSLECAMSETANLTLWTIDGREVGGVSLVQN
ncbi:MAG: hypothetical protein ACJA1R_002213, partial [Flavobacteriales bacterium]